MAKLTTITIKESAEQLTKLIGTSSSSIKPRLKMLLAIINGITSTQELALKTKSNRDSIRNWKNIYSSRGLDALMEDVRGGKRHGTLTDEQKAVLFAKLSSPKGGFTSYKQATEWINETFGVQMKYQAVNKYLKRNFGTKLKVGRKTHIKKDESAEALFKKTTREAKTY